MLLSFLFSFIFPYDSRQENSWAMQKVQQEAAGREELQSSVVIQVQ